jgi:predicted permease
VRNSLKGMASNPMPWSILLGGLASAMGWVLPGPVDKTVAMLAAAASPVALFTIGAVLARSQMNSHERVAARDYVPIALAKLLVHPLLVWAVGLAAISMGLGFSTKPWWCWCCWRPCLRPAMSLLTERYGAHSGRVARIILVSTSLAFLSFSAAVALMT